MLWKVEKRAQNLVSVHGKNFKIYNQLSMIIMVAGLPGSGKSYFSSRFARIIGAEYLKSQVLLKYLSLFDFSDTGKEQVYTLLLEEMPLALARHDIVLVDATFYKRKIRKRFQAIAHFLHQEFKVIEITADETLIRQRLSRFGTENVADWLVYKQILEKWEVIEKEHLTLVSTNDNIDEMMSEATKYIKEHHELQSN